MAKLARSALGEVVDFDLLAIKKNLAATPASVSVNQRRRFIDEKNGIKTRENFIVAPEIPSIPKQIDEDSPLAAASAAVSKSKKAAE
jgi:hypothetical protein